MRCPFCSLYPARVVDGDELAFTILDGFPVSPGHTLVIPRRHVGSFFEITPAEREAMLRLLERAKARIDASHAPAGYNIGINDGPAAGQTVPHLHLHVHLIPRYAGDQADPRGGVRWVMPDKADYWSQATRTATGCRAGRAGRPCASTAVSSTPSSPRWRSTC